MSRRTLYAGLVLAGAVLAGGVWWLADPVPEAGIDRARRALTDARRERAEEFAPVEFAEATAAWDRVLSLVRTESGTIAPLRSFDSVRAQVDVTVESARRARARAARVADSLETRLSGLGRDADGQLARLERAADHYPISYVDRDALSLAREYRAHREGAARNGRLILAVQLAEKQATTVGRIQAGFEERLRPVVSQVPEWRASVRRLKAAAGRDPVVVVDKAARTLYVHRAGRTDSFRVEFGRNWLGPKKMEGDDATPEGEYRVVRRLGRGDTRYHRALLINYPNESDRVRFERARAAGTIPRGARIGGSIELHGSGGRQVDWTDGCVALTNRDMERVFAMVPIGSRVLIAGSLSTDLPYVHDSPDD
jgi:hypothetical protein